MWLSNFVITHLITDQIGLHSVLLPVLRRTVLSRKLIPNLYLKITAKVWVRLIGKYFPETNVSDHSYFYNFKQIKGHTMLVIDFYKCGGSEKNRLNCFLAGV